MFSGCSESTRSSEVVILIFLISSCSWEMNRSNINPQRARFTGESVSWSARIVRTPLFILWVALPLSRLRRSVKPIWESRRRLGSLLQWPTTAPSPCRHLSVPPSVQSAATLPKGRFRWSAVSLSLFSLKDTGTIPVTFASLLPDLSPSYRVFLSCNESSESRLIWSEIRVADEMRGSRLPSNKITQKKGERGLRGRTSAAVHSVSE